MVIYEKRRFERKDCWLEAHYESPTLSLKAVVKNISCGGCFINTPYLDTIGTSGMIFIKPPYGRSPIAIPTRVVYTRDDTVESSGMGIKFQFYHPEDIIKITHIMGWI